MLSCWMEGWRDGGREGWRKGGCRNDLVSPVLGTFLTLTLFPSHVLQEFCFSLNYILPEPEKEMSLLLLFFIFYKNL